MSWRARFQQQLAQRCHPIIQRARALYAGAIFPGSAKRGSFLGAWPGLLTFTLLTLAVMIGLPLLMRASSGAAAQALPVGLAQLATPIPLGTATKSVAVATNMPTTTPSATYRAATATWTAFPTATQIADSPLLTKPLVPIQIVPLPPGRRGPQLDPSAVIAQSPTAATTAAPESPATVEQGVTAGGSLILVPTPAATHTITEALNQPVAAEAPGEGATHAPTVTEAEAAAPAPTATAGIIPTPDGSVRTVRVPILMYHYLSVPPADADIYRLDLSVTPDLFAAHLDAMQQAGYTTISLYALIDHLTHGTPLPEKPVVLTFDDGYVDNYTNAFPMLRDRGMTATFFLVTDFIDNQRPEYLTWDMVREMYAAGMSIEGHGRDHTSLANKNNDQLIWQALGTYEAIERETGVRARFICYPAGQYDQATIDIFRSADYWAGFTTVQGATHRSDDLFGMHRVRIRGSTSAEELLRLLSLDW